MLCKFVACRPTQASLHTHDVYIFTWWSQYYLRGTWDTICLYWSVDQLSYKAHLKASTWSIMISRLLSQSMTNLWKFTPRGQQTGTCFLLRKKWAQSLGNNWESCLNISYGVRSLSICTHVVSSITKPLSSVLYGAGVAFLMHSCPTQHSQATLELPCSTNFPLFCLGGPHTSITFSTSVPTLGHGRYENVVQWTTFFPLMWALLSKTVKSMNYHQKYTGRM